MNLDADNREFFLQAKLESERRWKSVRIHPAVYGLQVQPGTIWLPGLDAAGIYGFEEAMGFSFPEIYRDYLGTMNGTDQPAINIYGSSGTPPRFGPGYYSFPRDLDIIRDTVSWIYEACGIDEAFVQANLVPHIMPIAGHRCLVVDNSHEYAVLSMYGDDIIPYARDLKKFLFHAILATDNFSYDNTEVREAIQVRVPYWERYWREAPDESAG